jgi:hypothetical protein
MVGESTEPLSFHADMLKQHATLIIWPKLFGDIRHFKWISLGTHDDDILVKLFDIFIVVKHVQFVVDENQHFAPVYWPRPLIIRVCLNVLLF